MSIEIPVIFGPDFFDKQYFEPDPSNPIISNYHLAENGSRVQLTLATLHIIAETIGSRAVNGNLAIIDLGGAKGLLASSIQYFLPHSRVINSDWSDYATKHALGRVKPNTVRNDMRNLPFTTDKFDAVVCLDTLEHIPENAIPNTLQEIKRVLHSDGRAFLVPNIGEDAATSLDPSHVTMKPLDWWQKQVEKAGLLPIESYSVKFARLLSSSPSIHQTPTIRPGLIVARKI